MRYFINLLQKSAKISSVKKIKKISLQRFIRSWITVLALLILAVVFGGLLVARQYHLSQKHPTKSDRYADVYNPPGAATPSAFPQAISHLPPENKSVHVPILLYHYVEYNPNPKDTIRTKLSVTSFWFEKQLQYLNANGYTSVTFTDLYEAIRKGKSLPPKPVILTFDDGYRDFYTDAWPLLKKYHVKATEFVIAGFLDKPNYLLSWQLSQIATDSSRLVTIGAHTTHHPALPTLPPEKAFAEIFNSKKVLEEKLNMPVTVFNYPYGQFDSTVEALVKKAGFQMAVSTLFGATESWQNIFILPRVRVGNYDGAAFASRLTVKS